MSIESIIGLSMLPMLVLLLVLFGFRVEFGFMACIQLFALVLRVNMYLRTRNVGFFWMAHALTFIFIFALHLALFGLERARHEFPFLAVLVILALVIIVPILSRRKIKWRTREILELESLAAFIRSNLLAIPYREQDSVVFSLPGSYWKQIGLKKGYADDTWVSNGREGNVSAFISKADYMKYKDRFSFDQLCQSPGSLNIEFFELFRQGEGDTEMR